LDQAPILVFVSQSRDTQIQAFKGEIVKKYAKTLVAIAFLLGLTGVVKAEAEEGVIVTLPFEFVVGAKTLPPGTYTVRNLSLNGPGALQLSNKDLSASMYVLPYLNESVIGGKPELSFEQVGGQHFLSAIQTAATVYRIHVSDSSVKEAVAKSRDNNPASVSRGGK
jgi:hypothetical protein